MDEEPNGFKIVMRGGAQTREVRTTIRKKSASSLVVMENLYKDKTFSRSSTFHAVPFRSVPLRDFVG